MSFHIFAKNDFWDFFVTAVLVATSDFMWSTLRQRPNWVTFNFASVLQYNINADVFPTLASVYMAGFH